MAEVRGGERGSIRFSQRLFFILSASFRLHLGMHTRPCQLRFVISPGRMPGNAPSGFRRFLHFKIEKDRGEVQRLLKVKIGAGLERTGAILSGIRSAADRQPRRAEAIVAAQTAHQADAAVERHIEIGDQQLRRSPAFRHALLQRFQRRLGRRKTEQIDVYLLLPADIVEIEEIIPAVVDVNDGRHSAPRFGYCSNEPRCPSTARYRDFTKIRSILSKNHFAKSAATASPAY
ncbi:hypothetical protein RHECNPAF_2940010 [Rhizobium etli CNPAF512]|nr:hypothetical protein RHECNPAF_2940010 [Rhizobium etli CNPAF512]